MVRCSQAALLLSIALIASSASSRPLSISIASVVVVKTALDNGSSNVDAEAAKSCSGMTVPGARVALWFKHATEVPKDGFHERATITGCSLSGYLVTDRGKRYAWNLDIGGAGLIYLSSKANAICLLGPEISMASK